MLQIDGKKTLKKKRGTTKDIISEVTSTYRDTWHTTAELAATLKCDTEENTCKAIFDYVIKNIRYNEDPPGVQWVRTPARLIHDAEGDCKSMAILTASLLANLDIPCFFRFVSFSPNKQITHVYVVTNGGIIIDPVERVNGQPIFNYASSYTHKIDMNTTEISRLSGVGAVEDIYAPYMADTCFIDNTIAENYLFSELDYIATLCRVFPTELEHFNALDRVVVAYNLYQRSKGYSELMAIAGYVIQTMEDKGYFAFNSLDEELRAENLKELIDTALDMLLGSGELTDTGMYVEWWNTQIKNKDYNGLTAEQKENFNNSVGIGLTSAQKNALLADMQKSAPYFFYLYLGSNWVNENRQRFPKIYKKYIIEQRIFENWVKGVTGVLDKTTIYNSLKSGFLKRTNQTPEQFLKRILTANGYKIGIAPIIIAAIISGVVAIIGEVIKAIKDLRIAKMTDVSNYPGGEPSDYDFSMSTIEEGNNTENSPETKNKSTLIIGALAVLMLFMTKKQKNKKK